MNNPNRSAPENVLARGLVNRLRHTARNGAARYTPAGVALLEAAADDIERLMREGKAPTRLLFDLTEAENVLLTEMWIQLRFWTPLEAEALAQRLMRGEVETQAESRDLLRELLSPAAIVRESASLLATLDAKYPSVETN
jgi:hypothetical protein